MSATYSKILPSKLSNGKANVNKMLTKDDYG